jgi:hypothetical protein
MPKTPHVERHFMAGEVVRDVVIGIIYDGRRADVKAETHVTRRSRIIRLLLPRSLNSSARRACRFR